jgi:hypothetical protein
MYLSLFILSGGCSEVTFLMLLVSVLFSLLVLVLSSHLCVCYPAL